MFSFMFQIFKTKIFTFWSTCEKRVDGMMPVATAPILSMHYVKKIAANVPMNQIGIILSVDVCISVRRLREPHLMKPMLSAILEECVIWSCVESCRVMSSQVESSQVKSSQVKWSTQSKMFLWISFYIYGNSTTFRTSLDVCYAAYQ